MKRFLLLFAVAAGWAAAQSSERMTLPFSASYVSVVTLLPDKPEATAGFGIDSGDAVDICVFGSSLTMQVSLIDPMGAERQPDMTSTRSEDPALVQFDFAMVNVTAGKWSIKVKEPASFTGARFAQYTVNMQSSVVAGVLGADRDYAVNQDFTLALLLNDSRGALPAGTVGEVKAIVVMKGKPGVTVTMLDDGLGNDVAAGDGIFTGTVKLAEAGRYGVSILAAGTARNGQPFSRTASGSFSVIEPCIALTEAFQSSFDAQSGLKITLPVRAAKDGRVAADVVVTAVNGAKATGSAAADVKAGTQTLSVAITLAWINSLKANGPYQVSLARLSCVDAATGEHRTSWEDTDLGPTVAVDAGVRGAGLVVAPGTVDFGKVAAGQSGQGKITITNQAATGAKVTALSTAAPFAVMSPAVPFTIDAGASAVVTVSFSPISAVTSQGTLSVTSSDPVNPVLKASLSGTGTAAASVPAIEVTPAMLDFGAVAAGQTKDLKFSVGNVGAGPLTVTAVTCADTAYTVTAPPTPFTIGAGARIEITVRFSPQAGVTVLSKATVASDDPNKPSLTVTLAGTGQTSAAASIGVAGGPLDFETVETGKWKDLPVTISNSGGAGLTVTGLTFDNSVFSTSTGAPFTVAAGGNKVIDIRFSPTAAGRQRGVATILSNDPAKTTVTVGMAGIGEAAAGPSPSIDVSPASVAFGTVVAGQVKDMSVTVKNSGGAALNVTALTIDNAAFTVSGPATPLTIAAGGQQAVSVRFAPTAAGAEQGTLTVASNDPKRPPVTVSLSGTGQAAVASQSNIDVSPLKLDFGTVAVGKSKDLDLTVSNAAGKSTLNVSSATIDNSAYSVVSPPIPLAVAFGGVARVIVRFSPTAIASAFSATLTIKSDAVNQPVLTIPLTGNSIAAGPRIVELAVDDGVFERAIGYDKGGVQGYFVTRLTPAAYPATLNKVRIYFHNKQGGLAQYTGISVLRGSVGAGTASLDGVQLRATSERVMTPGGWNEFDVPATTIETGDFVVGFTVNNPAGVLPMAQDTTPPSKGRSYMGTDDSKLLPVDANISQMGNFPIRAVAAVGTP